MNPVYPDSPVQLSLRTDKLTARDAIGILLILPQFGSSRRYHLVERIVREIGRKAHRYQYQGDWKIVREILEQSNFQSWIDTWRVFLPYCSEQDWFGNVIPLMKQSFRKITMKTEYISAVEDTRPVVKPQRKRGYTDKGSRRPENSLCWFFPDSEDNRLKEPNYKTVRNHQWFNHLRC
jgi:hypothetical protein